jgi:regulator of protease activity HflC (stomatin/prohibitin superfamily)
VETLFAFIGELISKLRVFIIVEQTQRGVLLRRGVLEKKLEPGWHWLWPVIHNARVANVVTDIAHMREQSLITSDNKDISVSAVVTYEVTDIEAFLLKVAQTNDAPVVDIATGTIGEWTLTHTLDELRDPKKWRELARDMRENAAEYGIRIRKVKLSDVARAKTIRLLGNLS